MVINYPLQPKKVKNISRDVFGSKMGRIHMPRQDFKKLQVKRGRALRPEKKAKGKGKNWTINSSWNTNMVHSINKFDTLLFRILLFPF